MPKPTEYDVWFTAANTVYRGVPFAVLAGWAGQGRVAGTDKIREVGNEAWSPVSENPLVADYLGSGEPAPLATEATAAYEPVVVDVGWPKHFSDEDDDVDMIPLIDISLVLLIFFMMTTAVTAYSPVMVPDLKYAGELSPDKDTISLNVDKQGDQPMYSVSVGTERKQDEKNPSDLKAVLVLLDKELAKAARPPEVRIACHKDLPRWVVGDLMQELKTRKDKNQIAIFSAEVSEKSK